MKFLFPKHGGLHIMIFMTGTLTLGPPIFIDTMISVPPPPSSPPSSYSIICTLCDLQILTPPPPPPPPLSPSPLPPCFSSHSVSSFCFSYFLSSFPFSSSPFPLPLPLKNILGMVTMTNTTSKLLSGGTKSPRGSTGKFNCPHLSTLHLSSKFLTSGGSCPLPVLRRVW